VALAKVDATEN